MFRFDVETINKIVISLTPQVNRPHIPYQV